MGKSAWDQVIEEPEQAPPPGEPNLYTSEDVFEELVEMADEAGRDDVSLKLLELAREIYGIYPEKSCYNGDGDPIPTKKMYSNGIDQIECEAGTNCPGQCMGDKGHGNRSVLSFTSPYGMMDVIVNGNKFPEAESVVMLFHGGSERDSLVNLLSAASKELDRPPEEEER